MRSLQMIESLGGGGAEAYVLSLTEGLNEAGWPTTLIARQGSLFTEQDFVVPVSGGGRMTGWLRAINGITAQPPVSLVNVHSLAPLPSAAAWAKRRGVPLVFTYHGTSGLGVGRLARLLRVIRPTLVIAVSDDLQVELLANGVTSTLIRNAVRDKNRAGATCASRRSPAELVYVARFDPVKNHEMMLEAFAIAHEHCPDTRLHLVGDGELRARIASRARDLALHQHVVFHGFTDPHPILSRASLYVSSSLSEGLSLAHVEALMWGLPLVVTPTQGSGVLVRQGANGYVSADFTAKGLATVMVSALHRDIAEMGRASRQMYEESFRFEPFLAEVMRCYREALPGPGPAHPAIQ